MRPHTHRATVYDLSREILANIFIHAARLDPKWTVLRPGKSEGPFILSAVCAEWRAVATATPELWAHLEFNFALPELEKISTPLKLELVRTWLQNANGRPLGLDLAYHTPYNAEERGIDLSVNALKEVLEEFAARISVLKLKCGSNGVLGFFGQVPTGYPLLQELVIQPSADFDVFTVAPNVPLPVFPRVTRLSVSRHYGRDNLLSSGPAFVKLFQRFELPALQKLSLGLSRDFKPSVVHEPLMQICRAYASSLTGLSLAFECPTTVLADILQSTREQLVELRIVFTDEIIDALAEKTLCLPRSLASLWISVKLDACEEKRAGTSVALKSIEAIANVYGRSRDLDVFVLLKTFDDAKRYPIIGDCATFARKQGLNIGTDKHALKVPYLGGHHMAFELGFSSESRRGG
ncbi:F-box domain-containing protein [Mycena kentingensis (nom. inval.)]|nr:F-box domain-containing protein [Mycena kentingensis (nom. inval.)]